MQIEDSTEQGTTVSRTVASEHLSVRALTALQGSIAKWEAIVAGTGADHGAENCPLCVEFSNITDDDEYADGCKGCPVSAKVGEVQCSNTPYYRWVGASGHFNYPIVAKTPEQVAAAQAELDFLRSLLEASTSPRDMREPASRLPWTQWVRHAKAFSGPISENKPGSIKGAAKQPMVEVFDCDPWARQDITEDDDEAEAAALKDAAYIVHACNAYPHLVLALRNAALTFDISKPEGMRKQVAMINDLLRELGELK